MSNDHHNFNASVFYSYSHVDSSYRCELEKTLSLLKQSNLISDWSDAQILPGTSISSAIIDKIDSSNIVLFLMSSNFIASAACVEEWNRVKGRGKSTGCIFRIPIILEHCSWKDFIGHDDVKAMPNDGRPISSFRDSSEAWEQIYNGVKSSVRALMGVFTPKQDFLSQLNETDFLAEYRIKLEEIFIFPRLTTYSPPADDGSMIEEDITTEQQLLKRSHVIIHGEELSGKTSIARHMFSDITSENKPVILMDGRTVSGSQHEKLLRKTYTEQFVGDYNIWNKTTNKTLILDNMKPDADTLNFLENASDLFGRIIAIASSDNYVSYFRDEVRLAKYDCLKIQPLTHVQQEKLIRKRIGLNNNKINQSDSAIDQIENKVNAIVISNKIVPRHPFFILTILQTYEAYMPDGLSISSYGHCYHALIVALLIKAGIREIDQDLNTCFTYAENLAFQQFEIENNGEIWSNEEYNNFHSQYKDKYIIHDSIVNRMTNGEYGIIANDGTFRNSYMHYFFLGRYFANHKSEHDCHIEKICEQAYLGRNHLILQFIIHHTNDVKIVEDIAIRTMCSLDCVEPAILDGRETKRFHKILSGIPKDIMSKNSVEDERDHDRRQRDKSENNIADIDGDDHNENRHYVNDIYRVIKCNKILGQILRNNYGTFPKERIEELIEIIADGGLRLVNSLLANEDEIRELAEYVQSKHRFSNSNRIENMLRKLSFIWTMVNIEYVVSSINIPELRDSITRVVAKNNTPAYDIIDYFSKLDTGDVLTDDIRKELANQLKIYKSGFVSSVMSIRTQHYMNTHDVDEKVIQSVCSLLGIKYKYRPKIK